MKKILSLMLAVVMVVSCFFVFTACGDDKKKSNAVTSANNNSATKDESSGIVATEFATETATVPAEEEVVEYDINDFVYTYKETSVSYDGVFYCKDEVVSCRMPMLTIDSDYAREVNSFLAERLERYFSEELTEDQCLDYVAALNGNILSLAVEVHYPANGSYSLYTFNINVDTGEEVLTEDVVAMSDITLTQMYDYVAEDINAIFDEIAAANPQITESPMFTEPKEKTLSYENIKESTCYFDSDGKLNVVYYRYYLAGPMGNTQFLHLDANFVG